MHGEGQRLIAKGHLSNSGLNREPKWLRLPNKISGFVSWMRAFSFDG